MNTRELALKAVALRKATWQMIYSAQTGHTGSDLSCTDILVALYYSVLRQDPQHFDDPNRDRYLQSKGHAVEILYNVLADRGYFPKSDLQTFSTFGSPYIGHPTNHVNGIEMNTGSLGHGLGLGVGIAKAAKLDGRQYQTYVLMGDGEQAEGSVWEAAMAAGSFGLDNLTAIIDHNRLQISGPTTQVMNSEPLAAKYQAFGFEVRQVDGHDLAALVEVLTAPRISGKPRVVIADTIKGKGVSFAENQAGWHHRVPTASEYAAGMAAFDAEIRRLTNE